jgi:hypothetical protein
MAVLTGFFRLAAAVQRFSAAPCEDKLPALPGNNLGSQRAFKFRHLFSPWDCKYAEMYMSIEPDAMNL